MTLITGDCVAVMAAMPEASVDAIVTDPPYGLEFMGKEWDRLDVIPGRSAWNGDGRERRYGWHGGGRTDPSQMQEWHHRWAIEALRVAKPGAYLLAFGGTRTVHRLTCAIEDAGWIIRDTLVWVYASGFPKSRANLKPSWEPIVMARKPGPLRHLNIEQCRIVSGPTAIMDGWEGDPSFCASCAADADFQERLGTPGTRASTTPRRAEPTLSGWDTPTDTSRAAIGCSDGTTAESTDTSSSTAESGKGPTDLSRAAWSSTTSTATSSTTASRTCTSCGAPITPTTTSGTRSATETEPRAGTTSENTASVGRWPPNVLLTAPAFDGGWDGVVGGGTTSSGKMMPTEPNATRMVYGQDAAAGYTTMETYGDTGTYSRFFVLPKAPPIERRLPDGTRSSHPTVKPLELMRHLVRLVTPTGGTCLDPFAGSGTTLIAAEMEGFGWVGIEREESYVAIAEARLAGVQRGLGLDVAAPSPTGLGRQRGNRDENGNPTLGSRRTDELIWKSYQPDDEPAA